MKQPNAAQLAQFEEVWEMESDVRIRWNSREPFGVRIFGSVEQIADKLRAALLSEHTQSWLERGCPESFYPVLRELAGVSLGFRDEIAADHERDLGRSGVGAFDRAVERYGEHDFTNDFKS